MGFYTLSLVVYLEWVLAAYRCADGPVASGRCTDHGCAVETGGTRDGPFVPR